MSNKLGRVFNNEGVGQMEIEVLLANQTSRCKDILKITHLQQHNHLLKLKKLKKYTDSEIKEKPMILFLETQLHFIHKEKMKSLKWNTFYSLKNHF